MKTFEVELYKNVCQSKVVTVEANSITEAEGIVEDSDKYWNGGFEDEDVRHTLITSTFEREITK